MLRIHNDIMSAVDKGFGMVPVMLDLSAAFFMVDHIILLTSLKKHIGVDGCALRLFASYLTGRSQCVSVEGVLSDASEHVRYVFPKARF